MARDFDEERRSRREDVEHSFTIADRTFTFRQAIRPDEIVDYYDLRDGMAVGLDNKEGLALLDDTVLRLLTPGQEDKWAEARAVDDDDLTIRLRDLHDIIEYVIEVTSGRPTVPPTDSSAGRNGTAATTSTPDSTSTVEPATT